MIPSHPFRIKLFWFLVFVLFFGVSRQGVQAQVKPAVRTPISVCEPFKGRKLSLVIPFKPGGGYDLMGRALTPVLADYSGMSVAVANVTGGNGVQALKWIVESRNTKPTLGLINLATLTTQMLESRSNVKLSDLQGVGILSTEPMVWVSKEKIDWQKPPQKPLLAAATSSPHFRLGMPAQLMGIPVKPIYGYEGSNDGWLALLRGDVDVLPMTDATAKRNLASVTGVHVTLTLTNKPHADFPGVPYLAGEGGLLARSLKSMAPGAKKRALELAELAVMLSEGTRALVVSKKTSVSLTACLESATQAAMRDGELLEMAKLQKFSFDPMGAKATTAKIQRLSDILKTHGDYLKVLVSSGQVER